MDSLFARVMRSGPETHFLIDPRSWTIMWVSQRITELAGWQPADVIGKRIQEFEESTPSTAALWSEITSTMAEGQVVMFDSRFRCADGDTNAIEVRLTMIRDEANRLLVATARNVESRVQMEQHLLEHEETLTAAIRALAELKDIATLDALTGLPNRGHFQKRLETVLATSSASGDHVALLFLDLDGFKTINDSLGHSHGDELLQLAGIRLGEQLRPTDFIARIGGDEFVVLLPHLGLHMVDAEGAASEVAGRIVDRMSEPFHLKSQTVRISVSVGIALTPPSAIDAEGLLRQADLAMYAAKESGRGAFRVFDHQMDAEAHRALLLDGELRRAEEKNELAIYLQPRIEVATGRLSGAEALLRWPNDRPDPVDTASIVATAERNGLILPIGRWVLGETIRLARQLYEAGVITAGMTISVNISGHQLEREEFAGELAVLIDEADLPPGIITVELTESALVSDLFQARRRLRELEAIGVPMAIDDFGTGYSSLAYLRDLPVRELKLDRMFIADLGLDPVAETIVEGVIGIAQKLGIDTIAEGVERPDQLAFLATTGCTHYQGYLESAALAPEDFMCRYSRANAV